jgi:hypothetical protein
MRLDDFIMLGKTIPEPNSDGRIFVCSAGISPEFRSLVRLYPLSRFDSPPRWSVCEVTVQRNPRDSRRESFQIAGDRTPDAHPAINGRFRILGTIARDHRDRLLAPYAGGNIAELNAQRRSLAVLHPTAPARLLFEESSESPESPQLSLFADNEPQARMLGARRFAYQPRLEFQDGAGWHNLQLRDWGAYEFMRKHGYRRRHELAQALQLPANPALLVGNMANRRNVWLVISVLHPPEQHDLFANADQHADEVLA